MGQGASSSMPGSWRAPGWGYQHFECFIQQQIGAWPSEVYVGHGEERTAGDRDRNLSELVTYRVLCFRVESVVEAERVVEPPALFTARKDEVPEQRVPGVGLETLVESEGVSIVASSFEGDATHDPERAREKGHRGAQGCEVSG